MVSILYHKRYVQLLLRDNILFSNMHSFSWDENTKVLNIYPFCLIIMKKTLNAHLLAGNVVTTQTIPAVFL